MPEYPRTPFKRVSDIISPKVDGDSLDIPTGRCATLTVAANDSSALSKQQADYVCDGTNDATILKAAITTVSNNGGTLFLLSGEYLLNENINTYALGLNGSDGFAIIGEGRGRTIIKSSVDFAAGVSLLVFGDWPNAPYPQYKNILLRDFTIDCSNQVSANSSGIVFNVNVVDSIIERIEFIAGTLYCLDISDCTRITVRDCILNPSTKQGLFLFHDVVGYGEDAHLIDNVVFNGGSRGINLIGSECNTIKNCRFINQTDRAYYAIPTTNYEAKYNTVKSNKFYGLAGASSIIETSGDYTTIRNNYIFPSNQYGIALVGEIAAKPVATKHCGLYENYILGGEPYGIWLQSAQHNSIKDNRIISAHANSYGIRTMHYAGDHSLYNEVIRNHIDVVNTAIHDTDGSNIIYEQYSNVFMDVLAVSTTYIRSNEDLSAGTPITFTLDAQPDIPRTLSWSFDTHAQITEYDIEVIGVDAKGNTITETWDETAGWSGETSNAFATITSIKMTSRTGTGVADTMDIGITDVLGLSNIIYETSDVFKIKKNNANATVATAQVNTTYDTYDMSVIGLGAGDDFTVWYKSNLNIIS